MGKAAKRWKKLVEGRLGEMERLEPGRGDVGGKFWDKRVRRIAKGPLATAEGDPMLARLRRAVGRPGTSTVLDVGSGPGRFTMSIAPRVRQVVAVDPSVKMLQLLRRRARDAGMRNIRTVLGKWQDVEVEPVDVVLCSHVLTLVADVVPFLEKLHASARRQVLLYVGAYSVDAILDPFWRHFHDKPRSPGPSYVDAVAVLEEMGLRPHVEVVELKSRNRHDTLEEAVEAYRDMLVLPKTDEVRHQLTRLLDPWLQRRSDGLYAPFRTQPAAILSWSASAPVP